MNKKYALFKNNLVCLICNPYDVADKLSASVYLRVTTPPDAINRFNSSGLGRYKSNIFSGTY
jgi:hypothetical protein